MKKYPIIIEISGFSHNNWFKELIALLLFGKFRVRKK